MSTRLMGTSDHSARIAWTPSASAAVAARTHAAAGASRAGVLTSSGAISPNAPATSTIPSAKTTGTGTGIAATKLRQDTIFMTPMNPYASATRTWKIVKGPA